MTQLPNAWEQRMTRRTFIGVAGAAGVGLAGIGLGGVELGLFRGGATAAAARDRVLIVIEMAGGNDGLTTVVPYGVGSYYDHRKATAIAADKVLRLDGTYGLHPALKRIHQRGVAVIQGVGTGDPDLSHFEMLRRLWAGQSNGNSTSTNGFFGRLCDEIGEPDAPAVGLSLGVGPTPTLVSERRLTASLDFQNPAAPLPDDSDVAAVWKAGYAAMSHPDRVDTIAMLGARKGIMGAIRMEDLVGRIPTPGGSYPKTDLGAQLQFAARLIAARAGIRVLHVPVNADFDTHENHVSKAATNLGMVDAALGAFWDDLDARRLSSSALVMTTSEFGRRVDDNGSGGLDHGAASVALLSGPVNPGFYGAVPSLDKLDGDGNLKASLRFEDYFGTVAEGWFGVPAKSVLPNSPSVLPGIFRT